MVLDRLISAIFKINDKLSNHARERNFIEKRFNYKSGSKKLFVLLPTWNNTFIEHYFLRNAFYGFGYSLLEYKFPQEILSSDYKATKRYFKIIERTARADMRRLKKEYGFSRVCVIGISLGTCNACMIANGNKDVDGLYLVAPGNCLAESMWTGLRTQSIREEMEKQGITLKDLKKYWFRLAPENNIGKMKDKPVHAILSRHDIIINYKCGEKLIKAIKSKKIKLIYKENRHIGHYITILLFYINPKKYLFD